MVDVLIANRRMLTMERARRFAVTLTSSVAEPRWNKAPQAKLPIRREW
jgi:hypothetical protein